MIASLLLATQIACFYQPPDGKLWLSAWLDTSDVNITVATGNLTIQGDRPLKFNSRLGINVSSFQYAQNFPVNYTAGEFPFPIEQMDETLTDAVVYLTIYPFKDVSAADRWQTTDAQIQELAEQIGNMTKRAWNPLQVLLRVAPEMNGNWFGYGLQPGKYINLWQRMHKIIKAVEPRVAFVWSPNYSVGYPYGSQNGRILDANLPADELKLLDTNKNGRLDSGDDAYLPFYPGDDYVDWVGLSFYWKGNNQIPGPSDYESTFNSGGFYETFAKGKNKPMMVSEGGAVYFPNNGLPRGVTELAIKQAWWRESITSTSFLNKYPLVKLFGLFEFEKIEDAGAFLSDRPLSDFRITNDTQVLEAFKADLGGIKDRYAFANAVAPPPPPTVKGSSDGKVGSAKNAEVKISTASAGLIAIFMVMSML